MAFWRGDEHRRAKQSDWRQKLQSVTVPQPLTQKAPKMADAPTPVPPEKSDAPAQSATVGQLDAIKSDLGTAASADAAKAGSKLKAFFVKHKEAFAIVGAVAVVLALLHFVV